MRHTQTTAAVSLRELLAQFVLEDVPDIAIKGLCADSRQLRLGEAYVALQGERVHGLDFIDTVSATAAVILVDADDARSRQSSHAALPMVRVPKLADRLGEIASRFHQQPSHQLPVCGVTGTDGKTSVCRFVVNALDRLGYRAGYIGTIGWGIGDDLSPNPLTTPDPVQLQKMIASLYADGAQFVALEVSSHALVQGRVSGVEFDVAALTNLGRDHLDYHIDLASYRAAKSRLFAWPSLSAMVVNADDDFGRFLHQQYQGQVPVTTYSLVDAGGRGDESALFASDITADVQGLQFVLHAGKRQWQVDTGLLGIFNVQNLLTAFGILRAFGLDQADCAAALADVSPVPGRMQQISSSAAARVVVDFAHTAQALESALAAMRLHCKGDVWVVFGCGGDRDAGKRPAMARVAERVADHVVVTNDNPRTESPDAIIRDILAGMQAPEQATVLEDRSDAIRHALAAASADDWVLVAGKGHEDYQIIGEQRLSFSDAAEIESFATGVQELSR